MTTQFDYSGLTLYPRGAWPAELLHESEARNQVNFHRARMNMRPLGDEEFKHLCAGAGFGSDLLGTVSQFLPLLAPLLTSL